MKYLIAAAVLLCACGTDAVVPPPDAEAIVSMPGFTFVPAEVTIKVGQTVAFDFPAEPHNVIFIKKPGAPEDIQETTRQIVTRRFNVAGSFPYECTIHPGMDGTVEVK